MLQVTADVFSGRPNPSWIIEDESQVREVLNEIARNRSVIAATDGGRAELGLGFRGLIVELGFYQFEWLKAVGFGIVGVCQNQTHNPEIRALIHFTLQQHSWLA